MIEVVLLIAMGLALLSESARVGGLCQGGRRSRAPRCICASAMCRRVWLQYLALAGKACLDPKGVGDDCMQCYLIAYEGIRQYGVSMSWDDIGEAEFLLFSFFVLVLEHRVASEGIDSGSGYELDSFCSLVEASRMKAGGTCAFL
jgi:hypothetical protein